MEKSIGIGATSVTRFLTLTTLVILSLSVIGLFFRYGLDRHRVFGFIHAFNFEQETNVPTLFTTLLLLCCAALLQITWKLSTKGWSRLSWLLLSLLALFLAYDEFGFVHESIARAISGKYPEWYFIIPYGIVGVVIATLFMPVLLRLSSKIQILMCVGAALYVVGALDSVRVITTMLGLYDPPSASASLVIIVEELAEIFGLILAIKALLLNLSSYTQDGLLIRIQQ